eukprot:m.180967 g.180967  ORF g.180967 m.180967 type:complete len:120 (+) comp39260_c0_seq49:742-1101(+)
MRAGRVADAPWSVCPWLFHFVSDKGHLARVLAYGVGMNVKAIEAESAHLDGAERCDKKLFRDWEKQEEKSDNKELKTLQSFQKGRLVHIKHVATPVMTPDEFSDMETAVICHGWPPHVW